MGRHSDKKHRVISDGGSSQPEPEQIDAIASSGGFATDALFGDPTLNLYGGSTPPSP